MQLRLFARLHETSVGDAIAVTRVDGSTATFIAYRVERFAKAAFPTEDVYGNTAGAPSCASSRAAVRSTGPAATTWTTSWCSPGAHERRGRHAAATPPPRRGSAPPASSSVTGSRVTAWHPPKYKLRLRNVVTGSPVAASPAAAMPGSATTSVPV
ncbi:MAG: peptidase sortase [Pseudonocardia sp.]|nr:peptidase sortase [Pseudonocardia sp.]